MKIELHIDPSLSETTVTVRTPARTPELGALLDRLAAGDAPLLGFREDGVAVPLDLDDILRFYGEEKDVRAQTTEAVYTPSGSGCTNWSSVWRACGSPGCPTRRS